MLGDMKNGFAVMDRAETPVGRTGRYWYIKCQSCGTVRTISTAHWNQGKFRCDCSKTFETPNRNPRRSTLVFTIRGITWPIETWAKTYDIPVGSIYRRSTERRRRQPWRTDEWVVFGEQGMPIAHDRDTGDNQLLESVRGHLQNLVSRYLISHVNMAAEVIAKEILRTHIVPLLNGTRPDAGSHTFQARSAEEKDWSNVRIANTEEEVAPSQPLPTPLAEEEDWSNVTIHSIDEDTSAGGPADKINFSASTLLQQLEAKLREPLLYDEYCQPVALWILAINEQTEEYHAFTDEGVLENYAKDPRHSNLAWSVREDISNLRLRGKKFFFNHPRQRVEFSD